MTSISFDDHDQTLLDALTRDVRLLSVAQATRLLDCDCEQTDAVIGKLSDAGYIAVERQIVSVEGEAGSPIYSWAEGDQEPGFRAAAYQLRKRWQTPRESHVLYPTDKACKLLGGTNVRPRSAGETDHDLWLTEVYLYYLTLNGIDQGLTWVSGDTLRHRGDADSFSGFLPDACLINQNGSINRIIEGGGKGYGAAKLSRLHDCYSQLGAYELW